MRVLGIETSCDDTGVGIVEDGRILVNLVSTQKIHSSYGGVVPELASREHAQVLEKLVETALAQVGSKPEDLDLIAATRGPGLIGTLLVGMNYAKGLAWALGKPFLGVHHLEAHLYGAMYDQGVKPPFLALMASGGHTHLFDVPALGDYRLIGATQDDAAGEAFDKAARVLGLSYPGGPEIERLAALGNPQAVPLPLPLAHQSGYEFSFSGLKTAVARIASSYPPADVAAGFQRVVVEHLAQVVHRAAQALGRDQVVVAGGVAANQALRQRLGQEKFRVVFPSLQLCSDNGAMVALAAEARSPGRDPLNLPALSYLPLGETPAKRLE